MSADKRRCRVPADEPAEPREHGVERWEAGGVGVVVGAGRPEMPVRMLAELLPALVRRVERLEERDGVGDVDEDRQRQLRGSRPQRIEAGVVDGDEAALRVPGPKPQALPDLEPACPASGRVAERSSLRLAEVRIGRPRVVVEAGEHGDAIGECRLPALDLGRERVALTAVEVHDHLDTALVEDRE
jgi:hypothetical protein